MTRLAEIGLLVLTVVNVITTALLWRLWLDAMETNWAFNVFFAGDAKATIRSEIVAAVVGGVVPAALAVLASARRWPRAYLVSLLCGGWVLAYLVLRVPPLTSLFYDPPIDVFGGGPLAESLGFIMWFRFDGFPAGALLLSLALLVSAGLEAVRTLASSTP